ncbi:MAG: inorganic diphosphatase [Acutalibacteraceae bacterium]
MTFEERKALVESYMGKTVRIEIDRPIGYEHKKGKYTLTYPINYGYIPGVYGGDGEELDVYLLGVKKPVREYTGKIIGIIHRENDDEDKLVMAPEGVILTKDEIYRQVQFQEQYYQTNIDALYR